MTAMAACLLSRKLTEEDPDWFKNKSALFAYLNQYINSGILDPQFVEKQYRVISWIGLEAGLKASQTSQFDVCVQTAMLVINTFRAEVIDKLSFAAVAFSGGDLKNSIG